MKKISLLLAMACGFLLHGQTTLTQAFNEPKVGDTEIIYGLDTSGFTGGMPITVTGSNVVWNYTKFKASQPALNNNYLSAASVTASANYPGCTFVQEAGLVYSYYKSSTTPTTQTELLGVQMTTLSINFTNSGIIARYPISQGYSLTDNLSGTFTSTVSGTCSGNITTTADGTGTLNLPEGFSFADVLRVKSVQNITLTALFVPVGVLKQTVYNYYHPSQKFPLLTITYVDVTSNLFGGFSSGYATGSINAFVTGIKENTLPDQALRVYPNPAQEEIKLELSAGLSNARITLYNQLGQTVLKTTETQHIGLKDLKSGIYTLELSTEQGILRKKLVKE